jgi:fructose-bisphosphate aldolase class II
MPAVTNAELLKKAQSGHYAVGAFNINNMEIVQAIVSAGKEKNSPAILAVSEGAIKYAGFEYIIALYRTAVEDSGLPLALHLDHGQDMEVIKHCIEGGFTSVMIDASKLPFKENISATKAVVELAHPKGISVEAELGRLAGVEDIVSVDEREAILTDPQSAKEFVQETGVDSLAVAIGTSHGAYKFKGDPKLDIERLKEIVKACNIPIVLHGASGVPDWVLTTATKFGAQLKGAKGVPDGAIREAVKNGVCKVNIDTDIRLAMLGAIRQVFAETPAEFDPRKYLGPAREAIKKVVGEKMDLLGSSGRAPDFQK